MTSTKQHTIFEDRWSVEPPDYEVGLFGYSYGHEACTQEYEEGVVADEHMHGDTDARGYVANTVTLICLDCGTKESFEDMVFVGFDEENH